MDDLKVTFDFTVDEAAEVQIASIRSSREAASWRRREQVKFVVACSVAMAVVLILAIHGSIASVALLAAVALGVSSLSEMPVASLQHPQGVTITFRAGRVLARSRGFASDEHRAGFLRRVRELVPPVPASPQTA